MPTSTWQPPTAASKYELPKWHGNQQYLTSWQPPVEPNEVTLHINLFWAYIARARLGTL